MDIEMLNIIVPDKNSTTRATTTPANEEISRFTNCNPRFIQYFMYYQKFVI
jgi:hypothetical protein